jgi:response regulator RpfG family c-di-GMP phosphodiesterase
LHDAGKVAIPDRILHKCDDLTAEEWEIMKTHATRGYEIFKESTRPILKMVGLIAKEHHENWDGRGYPDGLAGEEISIAGRIVHLADVFDALSHKRCYKKA